MFISSHIMKYFLLFYSLFQKHGTGYKHLRYYAPMAKKFFPSRKKKKGTQGGTPTTPDPTLN